MLEAGLVFLPLGGLPAELSGSVAQEVAGRHELLPSKLECMGRNQSQSERGAGGSLGTTALQGAHSGRGQQRGSRSQADLWLFRAFAARTMHGATSQHCSDLCVLN